MDGHAVVWGFAYRNTLRDEWAKNRQISKLPVYQFPEAPVILHPGFVLGKEDSLYGQAGIHPLFQTVDDREHFSQTLTAEDVCLHRNQNRIRTGKSIVAKQVEAAVRIQKDIFVFLFNKG